MMGGLAKGVLRLGEGALSIFDDAALSRQEEGGESFRKPGLIRI